MTPTASTLALRAASACISPTTQAAPAMSPFISSMLAAGLIEMPPVSNVTPLPTKATGLPSPPAPFQRNHHHARFVLGALRDAEQRVHAELLHRLGLEHLDRRRRPCPAPRRDGWNSAGVSTLARFVDEVAGDGNAGGDRLAHPPQPSWRRRRRRRPGWRGRAPAPPRPPSSWSCSGRKL